jgi:putative transposase
MSNLRRFHENGYIYFITNVTYNRQPLLAANADLLQKAIDACRSRCPFELIAWVIMPDHFHLVIDPGRMSISTVLQKIKMSFAAKYRNQHGLQSGRVWQHRFWDHVIRNQEDMNRHIEYIHYNPVKHGKVGRPLDWPHSSFGTYVGQGMYPADWCAVDISAAGEFGE